MGPITQNPVPDAPGPLTLESRAERLEKLRSTLGGSRPAEAVPTRLPALDAVLPGNGLGYGKVHEWLGIEELHPGQASARRGPWSPPLTLLTEMACSAAASPREGRDRLVWIGAAVWPYPASLVGGARGHPRVHLQRCLLVRAAHPADRLWAADLALRSRAAAAVIADGSGFDLAATRRLQLAAEAGGGVCLLGRPAWERGELSASATRWLVSHVRSPSVHRRWTVELLRCKGLRPTAHTPRVWVLEQDRATHTLRVAADVLDRSAEAPIREAARRRTG